MKIRYRRAALADLASIREFIRKSNPHAARHVIAEIKRLVDGLVDFPDRYRGGPLEGTREVVISKYGYIVTYVIEGHDIIVLSVFHAAQDKPRGG
jgi:toxin ParE1/3/4